MHVVNAHRQEHWHSLCIKVSTLTQAAKYWQNPAMVHSICMRCGVVWCGVVWCGVARVRCVVRSLAHAARKAHLDEVQGATALRVLLMVYPFGSSPGSCESPAVGSRHASQLAPAEQPH